MLAVLICLTRVLRFGGLPMLRQRVDGCGCQAQGPLPPDGHAKLAEELPSYLHLSKDVTGGQAAACAKGANGEHGLW
jgi:hypothetical protein